MRGTIPFMSTRTISPVEVATALRAIKSTSEAAILASVNGNHTAFKAAVTRNHKADRGAAAAHAWALGFVRNGDVADETIVVLSPEGQVALRSIGAQLGSTRKAA